MLVVLCLYIKTEKTTILWLCSVRVTNCQAVTKRAAVEAKEPPAGGMAEFISSKDMLTAHLTS